MVTGVLIFADGCALGTSQAGAAALLGFGGRWKALGQYLGPASQKEAELVGVCLGLESLKTPCEVTVHIPSTYVLSRPGSADWWRLDRAAKPHKVTYVVTPRSADHRQQAAETAAWKISLGLEVYPEFLSELSQAGSSAPPKKEVFAW